MNFISDELLLYLVYPNTDVSLSSVVVAPSPSTACNIFNVNTGFNLPISDLKVVNLSKSLTNNGYIVNISKPSMFH